MGGRGMRCMGDISPTPLWRGPWSKRRGTFWPKRPADVVVDLGGGTGFLLSQLAACGAVGGATLVNVDCSAAQLALAGGKGIRHVHASIGEFQRAHLAGLGKRFFYLMRSVLHYFGQDGLSPVLQHLRDQTVEGEFFLHQSASFDDEQEAACLNALYRHMHTHTNGTPR